MKPGRVIQECPHCSMLEHLRDWVKGQDQTVDAGDVAVFLGTLIYDFMSTQQEPEFAQMIVAAVEAARQTHKLHAEAYPSALALEVLAAKPSDKIGSCVGSA